MANLKSKKRKRRIFWFALLFVLIALAVSPVFRKRNLSIAVQTEKVTHRNLTELVVASGKLQPVIQVKLSPEVSGEITDLPFKEGQRVNKGDLLIKIKPDPYLASKNSAEANFKYSMANQNTAEANLEKAKAEFQRNEELARHNLISESDRQTAKTSYDVAVATVTGAIQQAEMARAQLAKANDDLSKTAIYSPITGIVTKLYSQVGERVVGTATMAGTDIMVISDLNQMEARVDVGEGDVVHIALNQNVRLEVDALKDRKFKGVVTEIANSAKNSDIASGSAAAAAASSSSSQEATKFQVKIRVLENESFRPGMSVTAEIETRSRTNVLTVPIMSVTRRIPKDFSSGTNTQQFTMVASKDPMPGSVTNGDKRKLGDALKPVEVVFIVDNGHAKMIPVKTGIEDDDYFEIMDGLSEGQEVVSGGAKAINRELEDGKPVQILPAKTDQPQWK